MASLTIPKLRQVTGNGATVPVGETWIIKTISSPSSQSYVTTLSMTVNGNTYRLFNSNGSNLGSESSYGTGSVANQVLHAGDTINASFTIYISYWILTTDFNINLTIPAYRYASLASLGTITVPVGETWIIKIGCLRVTYGGSSPGYESVDLNIDGNIHANIMKLEHQVVTGTVGGTFTNGSLILNAGDSVTASNPSGTAGASASFLLQLGYWILEQDF